jgi:hypothetical protein
VELDGQLADPKVRELLQKFVTVKIDLTDRSASNPGRATAQKYGVQYLPDLRVLNADGAQLGVVEAGDAADLVKQLSGYAGK